MIYALTNQFLVFLFTPLDKSLIESDSSRTYIRTIQRGRENFGFPTVKNIL